MGEPITRNENRTRQEQLLPADPVEANRAAIKRFVDAANAHDSKLLSEVVDEVFDPEMRSGNPMPIEASGSEGVKKVFALLHAAFPDLHIGVEDLIAEGDKVVTRERITGTHLGNYMGLSATGKRVAYNEITISRFENGRIVEAWAVVDVMSVMRQLGVIPSGPVSALKAIPRMLQARKALRSAGRA